MTPDRMAYDGRIGSRSLRSLGAHAIYASADGPIRLWSHGHWTSNLDIALVKPFTEHLVSSGGRITEILIEIESVDAAEFQASWEALTPIQQRTAPARIAEAVRYCQDDPERLQQHGFDMLFFGKDLPRRELDPRIARVVELIRSTPDGPGLSVRDLACAVDLSPSRLTHFFREQLETTIRRFRAWKRARMVVPIALEEHNLLNLAMEAGYADSTHFSHSMRSFFGMKARDLCEGSRRVAVSMSAPIRNGIHHRNEGLSLIG